MIAKLKTLVAQGRNALADVAAQAGAVTATVGPFSTTLYPRAAVVQRQPEPAPVPCTQAAPGSRLCIRCAKRHA